MQLFHKIDSLDIKHGISTISQITGIIAAISEFPAILMNTFNNIDVNLFNVYSV